MEPSLSPLASNQSLFIFLTPPPLCLLLSPVPISLPCSWPWVPSHAQLVNLHALPPLPVHVSKLHWRGDSSAWNVGFKTMCLGFMWVCKALFSGAETWKSPCLRIQMKCSKTGPEPLFEIELLSEAALPTQSVFHNRTTAISFMLLTNLDCFSFLVIFFNSLLINKISENSEIVHH